MHENSPFSIKNGTCEFSWSENLLKKNRDILRHFSLLEFSLKKFTFKLWLFFLSSITMQFNLDFNSSYFNFHAYHTIEIEQKKIVKMKFRYCCTPQNFCVVPFLPPLRFINRSIQNGSLLLYLDIKNRFRYVHQESSLCLKRPKLNFQFIEMIHREGAMEWANLITWIDLHW